MRKKNSAEEKTLFDVLHDIWQARVYMVVSAIIFTIFAFSFIAVAQKYYNAQMILAPAVPMGQSLHLGREVREGGLPIQPETFRSNAAFQQFENIYNGVAVASIVIHAPGVLEGLAQDRRFEFSSAETDWTAEKMADYIGRRVSFSPISGTPLRRLGYMHPNKRFAEEFITHVHRATDGMIRARNLREVGERINYLNKALETVENPDHRRNLAMLLLEQERIRMMAMMDQPFAATVIEPPFVSARPKWPDPYVMYPVFLCLGLLLGFVAYGVRHHGKE